ncbi:MAG: adenine phosphoribosyltransferase [Chloroflexi bacterium]|nr:adenine phosphoribosyltransferase [Chloroflexota bacterium]|tara:strand:+ start:639 stop:1154 length:516 start_codon:yes stop_codon:yes gene_type:complete
MNLKDYIREVPDYPKKDVSFKDITPLISNINAFKFCLDRMSYLINSIEKKVEYFASIDARGFIFGSALSDRLNIPNILIRKKGKLPPPVLSQNYNLEYGTSEIQVSKLTIPKEKNILIIDDLIASGGSAEASSILMESAGNNVLGICVGIKLSYLNPEKVFKKEIYSVCNY